MISKNRHMFAFKKLFTPSIFQFTTYINHRQKEKLVRFNSIKKFEKKLYLRHKKSSINNINIIILKNMLKKIKYNKKIIYYTFLNSNKI